MKKLSIALAVALAFAAVAPAMAAPSLALGGSLETKFEASQGTISNESFLSLQAGVQGGDGKTQAVVILSPWSKPDSIYAQRATGDPENPTAEFKIPSNAAAITDDRIVVDPTNPVGVSFQDGTMFSTDFKNMIRSMYLQSTGAFWNGGPEATTTIGSIAVNESPFVGDLGNRRGIKVEGLKVGPLGIEAFYTTPGGVARFLNHDQDYKNPQVKVENVDEVAGVKLNANLLGADLGANIIRSDENVEMAFTGAMSPLENLAVNGYIVRDRAENQALSVGGSYGLMPNLTLSASYRTADEEIAPLYPTRKDADGSGAIEVDEWIDSVNNQKYAAFDNRTGLKVGADATLAGVHVIGSYDMATTEADQNHTAAVAADTTLAGFKLNGSVEYLTEAKTTELTWGAEREFDLAGLKVKGAYAGEKDDADVMSHEFMAATTLNMIPQLQGLTVDGRYKTYSDATHDEIEANVNYQAPNGMTFGVNHVIDGDHTDGNTTFTTGMKVVF